MALQAVRKDSFSKDRNLEGQVISFRTYTTSFHVFLSFRVSLEKPACYSVGLVFLCDLVFSCVVSIFSARHLSVQIAVRCEKAILQSWLSGVLNDSCSWVDAFFNGFGDSSAIALLNIFSIPLACISSIFIFLTHQFGLLILYYISHIWIFVIFSSLYLYCYLNAHIYLPGLQDLLFCLILRSFYWWGLSLSIFNLFFISKISICFFFRISISLLNFTNTYSTDFLISLNCLY